MGFSVDSVKQAFLLPQKKREKFLFLLQSILKSNAVDVKTLQRFAGKCLSFAIAVPDARLFTNEINLAIAKGIRTSRPIPVSGHLKTEIESWKFLKSWDEHLPWRQESHSQIVLCSDASSFAWGGVFNPTLNPISIRDYWKPSQAALNIHAKEILALVNVLRSSPHRIRNTWVDVYTDSETLIKTWTRQGSKSHIISDSVKMLFSAVTYSNIHLNLHYISSAKNPADYPSRFCPCMIVSCHLRPGPRFKRTSEVISDTPLI